VCGGKEDVMENGEWGKEKRLGRVTVFSLSSRGCTIQCISFHTVTVFMCLSVHPIVESRERDDVRKEVRQEDEEDEERLNVILLISQRAPEQDEEDDVRAGWGQESISKNKAAGEADQRGEDAGAREWSV
jgi:hypothetical protein